MAMETYLVFGRAVYADPLSFQGSLETPAGMSPNQFAADTYGSQWVELVLIPVSEAYWAIQENAPRAMEAQP
jgi:hypothetical protein